MTVFYQNFGLDNFNALQLNNKQPTHKRDKTGIQIEIDNFV